MRMLDDRVVIVTGGGRGLGRAHCLELASHGAAVVVNDVGAGVHGEQQLGSPAAEVAEEIRARGGTAIVDDSSVADWDGMAQLVARTVSELGRLDAVVNNAGITRDRMLMTMSEEDVDLVLAVHVKGTIALSRHACAYWRLEAKAGRDVSGRIVNTTSGAGLFGNVGQSNYGAAKSAIATLTVITALEMARYGVTANAISPIAATRMTAGLAIGEIDDTTKAWQPRDPANASPLVAWLCSSQSAWLSGAVLRVDGNTVQRVRGWEIDQSATYTSASGERLRADELDAGLRAAWSCGIAS